jgi:uncharacterized protein (DUF302 family)
MSGSLSYNIHLDDTYEVALDMVKEALKEEGFGVLTNVDVKATLKKKLGEDFHQYAILGACNPQLAHRALAHQAEVGLMLPCNVIVEESPGEGVTVRIINPESLLAGAGMDGDPVLKEVAGQAAERLARVARSLAVASVS